MHALLFPNCGFRLPTSSPFNPLLRQLTFSGAEIADGALHLRRDLNQFSACGIRSEGSRRRHSPRRKTASDRAAKEDEEQNTERLVDGESSDLSSQEEIIALFRRIQTSIAKEGSALTRKHGSNEEEKQSAESVLHQHRSTKQGRGPRREEAKTSLKRRGAPKKESVAESGLSEGDFQLSRPPSNFVKRSPIPMPEIPKEKVSEDIKEGSLITTKEKELGSQRVDQLKLPELKELAKSRGVKGYSKLKKGELVELLRGVLQS